MLKCSYDQNAEGQQFSRPIGTKTQICIVIYLLTYMVVFGLKVCLTWRLRYKKIQMLVHTSLKSSSPARVTRAGFRQIRPVVCLESEFKDCNLA